MRRFTTLLRRVRKSLSSDGDLVVVCCHWSVGEMKRSSIIALLTDFGTHDPYVASMKGTILSINPNAQIIDISHDIEPHNIDQAAFILWSCFKYFPKNTIFIAVVDPGVGTSRKVLCLQTEKYCFLAPDNELLKFVISTASFPRVFGVTETKYFREVISSTFHGRDIFAPVAAYLSKGASPQKLGPRLQLSGKKETFIRIDSKKKGTYEGKVIHVDHFGNIVTNIMLAGSNVKRLKVRHGKFQINDFYQTYAQSKGEYPFMIIGSTGLLEISVKNSNAAKKLKAAMNQKVLLEVM